MGLFDFFKKKKDDSGNSNALFQHAQKYAAYWIQAIHFQQNDNYAPIAAYENNQGDMIGFLYIVEDMELSLSATEAVKRMTTLFESRFKDKTIKSYSIFYHSNNNHVVAEQVSDFKAISMQYQSLGQPKSFLELTYQVEGSEISYQPFAPFTPEQNNILFSTQLTEGQEYFQERITIEAEFVENELGIKVKKARNGSLENTWGGLLGFDFFRSESGRPFLTEYIARTATQPPLRKKDISIYPLSFGEVILNVVALQEVVKTAFPIVKTKTAISIQTKEITEWAHIDNLEAMIKGSGKDTFGVTYFATDYATHRDKYLSNKKLKIELSAICLVLDVSEQKEFNGLSDLSEQFVGYSPNKGLAHFGCFDFIGLLKRFKPVSIFDGHIKGYMMSVQLINHENIDDFFIVDVFVNQNNMRFKKLLVGMKITGMLQFQGCIKI
jgi:hypothetical protein